MCLRPSQSCEDSPNKGVRLSAIPPRSIAAGELWGVHDSCWRVKRRGKVYLFAVDERSSVVSQWMSCRNTVSRLSRVTNESGLEKLFI